MHLFLLFSFFKFYFSFKSFHLFLAAPPGMWDPNFLTTDGTHAPCTGSTRPNLWTAREVPLRAFLILKGTTLISLP